MANQSFRMTLRLVMMHHNTKFGEKMFGGLEDIIWTNIDILTLNAVIQLFSLDTLAYDDVSSDQVGGQGINSSENIVERVIF